MPGSRLTFAAAIRVVAVLIITRLLVGAAAAPSALAQTPALPAVRTLALPKRDFPHGARVSTVRATNQQADAATRIHTRTFEDLGRLDGLLQSATWGTGRAYVVFRYAASVFPTTAAAADAQSDALASLWEVGRPTARAGGTAYSIAERDGHLDLVRVGQAGAVETELWLRFRRGIRATSALRAFDSASRRVDATAIRYAALLPPTVASSEATPVYVAPWGTGPVVKSPSLITPQLGSITPDSSLSDATFRAASAPIAARAYQRPALVPNGALARSVWTGTLAGHELYATTSLFPSSAAASAAFTGLLTANDRKRWLRRDADVRLQVDPAAQPAAVWTGGETVVVAVDQNVLVVLAGAAAPDALATVGRSMVNGVPTALHAQGVQIVDANNNPVKLVGMNWYGAESPDFVVGGLDYQPYQSILTTIARSGYNVVRLPFSNQLVEQNPVVTAHLGANTALAGLHSLDILDRIVAYAGALGLRVILDDHRSDAGWSAEENGLWYTAAYPDAAFQQDWVIMARRYAVNDVVVGVDLRNEPHGPARWDNGDPTTDWLAAAERAGDDVLAVNPSLLILIEGVQSARSGDSYWWGGNLEDVATDPAALRFADGADARSQLVYSAHDYGPDDCGANCAWFNSQTTYDSLAQLWEEHWGFITSNPAASYAAPVWIGEFGTCTSSPSCGSDTTPGSQGQWFSSLIQYLREKGVGWAYWSLNGSQSTGPTRNYGAPDGYGFLSSDWSTPNSWLAQMLATIQS